jgi:hypothetical protein
MCHTEWLPIFIFLLNYGMTIFVELWYDTSQTMTQQSFENIFLTDRESGFQIVWCIAKLTEIS